MDGLGSTERSRGELKLLLTFVRLSIVLDLDI